VSVRLSVPSIDSSSGGRRVAAEVRRGQQISIDDSTAAAAQHAGRVNFGPTVRRSNILFIVVFTVDKY